MVIPQDYQQSYNAYIAAHQRFNIQAIEGIPNFDFQGISDLERQFIEKLNSGYGKTQGVVDLETAVNNIKNILDMGKQEVNTLKSLSSALEDMDKYIAVLQTQLNNSGNLSAILQTYTMWRARVDALSKIGNRLGSKNGGIPLKVYFDDSNQPVYLETKDTKVDEHSTYVSIAAIRNAAYGLLRKQLGLLSEQVVWSMIVSTAGASVLEAEEDMVKKITTKASGIRSTQTLNGGIRAFIMADPKKITPDKELLKSITQKAFQIVGNTPLVDVGGEVTQNEGTLELKITLKNIKENTGNDYTGTPLLRTQNRRLIIYAANAASGGDIEGALTYWGLLRAMGSKEYQADLSPLKRAMINHLGYEIAFGEGQDRANYMGINGKYIHITNWLKKIKDNPDKYLFVQSQSSSIVSDGKKRDTELESAGNYVPAENLLKVLTGEIFFMQRHLAL